METRSSGVRCLGDGLKAPRCLGTYWLGLGGKSLAGVVFVAFAFVVCILLSFNSSWPLL